MARRRRLKGSDPFGILLVDKPKGPSSRQVLDQVVRTLELPASGHCGTLDPLATGLMIIAVGTATRIQDELTGHNKVYWAEVFLGATSETCDAEGPIYPDESAGPAPSLDAVREAIANFVGEIEQIPPKYSAIHVGGQRLYELARRGEEVEIPSRIIQIDAIELLEYTYPKMTLRVACGTGTYIRSLARDLGQKLGVGAYLSDLRREKIAEFSVKDSRGLKDLSLEALVPLETVLAERPRVDVAKEKLAAFQNGQELATDARVGQNPVAWCDGQVIAKAVCTRPGFFRMKRLLRLPKDG